MYMPGLMNETFISSTLALTIIVEVSAMLQAIVPAFEALPEWNDESILNVMTKLAEDWDVKNAKVMWPVRIAAAGKAVTPGGAVEICRILGREETLRRLRIALEKLG